MRSIRILTLVFAAWSVAGCNSSKKPVDPGEPTFAAALFDVGSANVTNPYFTLTPGAVRLYQIQTEDGMETVVEEVLDETRTVDGVICAVVRVREYLGEMIQEDTLDWYAQDRSGNVWYLGEAVVNYEYDDDDELFETNTDGSWESGRDVAGVGSIAIAGIIMKASFSVGDVYPQEIYPGEAEDMGEIVATGVPVTLANGMTYNCVQTRDWNPLEPNSFELKYYASGVGLVMEHDEGDPDLRLELRTPLDTSNDSLPDFGTAAFTNPTSITNPYFPFAPGETQTYTKPTDDGGETIVSETLSDTRVVAGVNCVVVRVREYEDDVLVEETHDWYAQDDAGNVWYMGEDVVNFEYDDDNLVETNNDGAWEAGVDGALPGILMPATPVVGVTHYQEFYSAEAVDVGVVVRTGLTVTLRDGTVYPNCVQTLDWTPLEPGALEFKYYAPGVGLIREESLDGESATVDLTQAD